MIKIIIIKSKSVGDEFEKCSNTITKDEVVRLLLKDLLMECGFNSRLLGFQYLIDAIAFCCCDKNLLVGKTKALYYKVSKHNKVSKCSVERNIRTLIDVAGNSFGFDILYKKLNIPDTQKPNVLSNGILIDLLTQHFDDIL